MKTIKRATIVSAIAILSLASCVKEMDNGAKFGRMITVDVQSDNQAATKAETPISEPEYLELSGDGASDFYLIETEEDFCFTDEVETKGYNTSGKNFNSKYTSFRMDCFIPDGSELGNEVVMEDETNNAYFTAKTVGKKTSGWALETSYTWINDTDMTFWAFAPLATDGANYSDIAYADDHKSFTMKYALPAASTNASDAINQKDLVVAYKTKKILVKPNGEFADEKEDGKVGLQFSHALAAIKFDLSAIPENITVKKICLKNVASKATCSVTLSSGKPVFTWSGYDTANKTYSQAYSSTDFTSDVLSAGSEKIYMMIPQDFTSTTQITIEYTKTGVSGTFALAANLKCNNLQKGKNGTGWAAGKIYTYKLTDVSMILDVDVEDKVVYNVKKDLVITNKSNTYVYVRALLAGNWLDSCGRIYKTWSESEGTFTGKNTTDWVKVGDFWYYKKPVAAETAIPTANNLFTTYTPAKQPACGVTLNLVVASQVVPFDEAKSNAKIAWGDAAAAVLTTNK